MTNQEIKDKLVKYERVLAQTTDEKEKSVIQGVIDKLKSQLTEEKQEPEAPVKPESKPAEPKVKKKIIIKPKAKKAEKEKKPAAPAPAPKKTGKKKVKVTPKPKKEKGKKVEKTVKVSKVIPEGEKKTVRDVLEKENFKVIIKEVGGRKMKVLVRHSDRTIAKNKIASAFGTIGKKVNSEEEKKKYAKDVESLEKIQKAFMELIERIYKAFNSHDAKELSNIFRKIKSF